MTGHDGSAARIVLVRRSMLGNFLSLSGSTWCAQALGFLAIVYVARKLGAGALGQLALAQTVVLGFRFAADVGFDLMGSRRVAADPRAVVATAGELTACRLANAFIAGILLVLAAFVTNRFLPVGWLMVLFGLSLAPIALSLEWVFMGLERMDLVGLARITAAAVWLLLVVALGREISPLVAFPLAYVTGQACGTCLLFVQFRRVHGPIRVRFHRDRWVAALREASPIGLSLIVTQIYVGFGVVALGFLDGDRAAGLYVAPQRIVVFLTAASSLFGAALYPRLAALRAERHDGFERVVRLGFRLMLLASVPLGIGGILVASPLVAFVFGPGYEEGAAVFRWLVPSLVPVYVNALFGYALLAAGGERRYFTTAVAGATVTIVANLVLIPRLHVLGPVAAALAAQGLVLVMLAVYTRRLAAVRALRVATVATGSAALMVAALFFVPVNSLWLRILVGAIVYAAGVTAFKGLTGADIALLRDLAQTPPEARQGVSGARHDSSSAR